MDLQDSQKLLNDIDIRILDMLAERNKVLKDIDEKPEVDRTSFVNIESESEQIDYIKSVALEKGLDVNEVENIYKQIFSSYKKAIDVEVAFQGEDGSFGQEVAYSFFGHTAKTIQCDTIEKVYEHVQHGNIAYGIVPVENSQEGSIGRSYDLLLDSNVMVCGEAHVRTTYCLVTNKSASLNSIKKIYSHPQALGQCQAFLMHLGCEIILTYNTISTVKMIKEKKITDSAIVAGEGIAFKYDLKVLAREIEDNPMNSTRFFLLGKKDAQPTGKDKTSIVCLLKHQPGTLSTVIKEFAEREINLTKIESRPTRKTPWEYHFYLDFEGHRHDQKIIDVLDKLEKVCLFMKVLGSYPRAAHP